MITCEQISFWEQNHWIKVIDTEEELMKAYRLRHFVFCEKLNWVPANPIEIEMDQYDPEGIHIGVFSAEGNLVALARALYSNRSFMLENEFSALVGPAHTLRKERDTVEISRLTVMSSTGQQGLSSNYMCLLLKGIYQWCLVNDVRYVYLVIEKKMWRVLSYLGFSCIPIGPEVTLPPGDVTAMAVIVDLDRFCDQTQRKKQEFVRWMSTVQSDPVPVQWQPHAPDLRLQVS